MQLLRGGEGLCIVYQGRGAMLFRACMKGDGAVDALGSCSRQQRCMHGSQLLMVGAHAAVSALAHVSQDTVLQACARRCLPHCLLWTLVLGSCRRAVWLTV
jgi:hypothetical protein